MAEGVVWCAVTSQHCAPAGVWGEASRGHPGNSSGNFNFPSLAIYIGRVDTECTLNKERKRRSKEFPFFHPDND